MHNSIGTHKLLFPYYLSPFFHSSLPLSLPPLFLLPSQSYLSSSLALSVLLPMSTCHCLATNVYVLMSTYHQCRPTYLYLPTIATYQHLASYVNLSTSTSTYPFKSLYNRRRPRSHRSCSSPLYFHISLSLSLLLCLPTYDPFPTLTSHSLSPSSLSLSFISATCIPIPIYLFLIAVDPRAGIGLVNYELSSVKREEHKSPINQEANTTELLKSYHVCCVSIVMHVLEDRDQL